MTELPAGTVTIADLYRELVGMRSDLSAALTRIEVIDTQTKEAALVHSDHETRLRLLEIGAARLAGKLAMMAGGGSVAGGWIGYILGHFVH